MKLTLDLVTFDCPACGYLAYALPKHNQKIYLGHCDHCNGTFEVAPIEGTNRAKVIKRIIH